jgi:hypothetical protein
VFEPGKDWLVIVKSGIKHKQEGRIMMYKRIFQAVFLALVLLLGSPGHVFASEVQWQIDWLDNGTLQEEVRISGANIIPADPTWKQSQEGSKLVLQREIPNWSTYQDIQDGLPLQVKEKNYIFFRQTYIGLSSKHTEGLFGQIGDADRFELSIKVPGFIVATSADQREESLAQWSFPNSSALLTETKLLQVITMDGFLLGIGIFFLGLAIIGIMFFRRLKKAERIIDEEYGVPKANIDN